MKKIISLVLCLLVTASLFLTPFSANAEGAPSATNKVSLTFSEEYSLIYTDTAIFHRYNISLLSYDLTSLVEGAEFEVTFAGDNENVKEILIDRSENELIYWAYITYRDGSSLSCGYLREDMIPLYESMKITASEICTIDFEWPEENEISVDFSLLSKGPSVLLSENTLPFADFYIVYLKNADPDLMVARGQILIESGSYYYMDYAENDIEELYAYPGDYEALFAHPITDEALISQIREGVNKQSGFSLPFAEKATRAIGIGLLILLFGILPAGLSLFALLLCIRGKKASYRKIGLALLISSALCLLIFIGSAIAVCLL